MKKFFVFMFIGSLFLIQCNNDDDNIVEEISIEEQNTQDDGAIQVFLNNYYFNELGIVTAFDDEDPEDDNETPLIDMAMPLSDGVYYVVNPNVTANGPQVIYENIDNQDILIQYNFGAFSSGVNSETGEYLVNNYSVSQGYSTPTTTGLPRWNPTFYKLGTDSSILPENAEMPGFREAIPYFKATQRDVIDPFIFQGVIIIPSRANYARNVNNVYGLYNQVVVMNFELYNVVDSE